MQTQARIFPNWENRMREGGAVEMDALSLFSFGDGLVQQPNGKRQSEHALLTGPRASSRAAQNWGKLGGVPSRRGEPRRAAPCPHHTAAGCWEMLGIWVRCGVAPVAPLHPGQDLWGRGVMSVLPLASQWRRGPCPCGGHVPCPCPVGAGWMGTWHSVAPQVVMGGLGTSGVSQAWPRKRPRVGLETPGLSLS